MKLVCLNIWGGALFDPLAEFLKSVSRQTDIFCFQEVYQSKSDIQESHGIKPNVIVDLLSILTDFKYYFAPVRAGFDDAGPVNFDIVVGQAMFIRKNLSINSQGDISIIGKQRLQYCRLQLADKSLTIGNFHGLPQPGHKLDTPERLIQSRKIKEFFQKEEGGKILCGDFNLLPETESVARLEKDFMNLIAKFQVPTTRNLSLLSEKYGTGNVQKFADYLFVSPDIRVQEFKVLDLPISDHLPLVLEFH